MYFNKEISGRLYTQRKAIPAISNTGQILQQSTRIFIFQILLNPQGWGVKGGGIGPLYNASSEFQMNCKLREIYLQGINLENS